MLHVGIQEISARDVVRPGGWRNVGQHENLLGRSWDGMALLLFHSWNFVMQSAKVQGHWFPLIVDGTWSNSAAIEVLDDVLSEFSTKDVYLLLDSELDVGSVKLALGVVRRNQSICLFVGEEDVLLELGSDGGFSLIDTAPS